MPERPPESLAQVGLRLQALERDCSELREGATGQRAQVEKLRSQLQLLARGIFPPGTWPVLLIVLGSLLLGSIAGVWVWRKAAAVARLAAPRPALVEPLLPQLLVTSQPQAEVVLDGVPRGSTPLLLAMPARNAEHRVTLTAPGRGQATRIVQIKSHAGAHVHVDLAD